MGDASGARPHAASMLAGRWVGTDYGWAETVWMPARDGRVLGMFRWHDERGGVIVHELLSISEEDGEVVLRFRHFDAGLDPWKQEASGPITLVLAESTPTSLVWEARGGESRVARFEQAIVEGEDCERVLRSRVHFPEETGQPMVEVSMASMPLVDGTAE